MFGTHDFVFNVLIDVFLFVHNCPQIVDRIDVYIERDERRESSELWNRLKRLSRLLYLYFCNIAGHLNRHKKLASIQNKLGTNARSIRAVISVFQRIDDYVYHWCCKAHILSDRSYSGLKDLYRTRDDLLQYLFTCCNRNIVLLSTTSLFYLRRLAKSFQSIEASSVHEIPPFCKKLLNDVNNSLTSTCSIFVEDLTGTLVE